MIDRLLEMNMCRMDLYIICIEFHLSNSHLDMMLYMLNSLKYILKHMLGMMKLKHFGMYHMEIHIDHN